MAYDIDFTADIDVGKDANEIYSNRFLGIGKLTAKQAERKALRKETNAYKKLDKADALYAKAGVTPPASTTPDAGLPPDTGMTDTGAGFPEPEKKFLGMKKSIGIPVAIGGGLVIATGLFFLIRYFVNK
jgi:hypothetical protein